MHDITSPLPPDAPAVAPVPVTVGLTPSDGGSLAPAAVPAEPGAYAATPGAPSEAAWAGEAFRPYEPVTVIDSKQRRFLVFPEPDARLHIIGGYLDANLLLDQLPGVRLRTSKGQIVAAYRTTLDEYVLLMKRAATVIPPKDMAFMIQWADVFPGAHVVEAGIGSGALTLGLLRAVGERGRITAFELREDHANRARKNICAWPDAKPEGRLELRLGDVYQELATLSGVDRVMLDLPEPHLALPAAAKALKPGGIIMVYVPTIRQIDTFVLATMDGGDFAEAEVCEVMVRPWVADRSRLRPELRITGHTGFLARARRRGPIPPGTFKSAAERAAENDLRPPLAGDEVCHDRDDELNEL